MAVLLPQDTSVLGLEESAATPDPEAFDASVVEY